MSKGKLMIAAALLGLLMTPVGKAAAANQEKVVLTYFEWGSDVKTKQTEDYLFSYFTKLHPNISIQVQMTGSVAEHSEKVAAMYAAGVAPDLFTISGSTSYTPQFYDSGMVLDLTPYAQRDHFDFDAYLPGAWAYTWRNGKLWAFPRATKGSPYATGVLVYNRTLFEQAGLKYPWSGWSFADFLDTAKKLTRRASDSATPSQWGTSFSKTDWERYVWSNGGLLVNDAGTQTLLTDPPAVEALDWYSKWPNEFGIVGGSFDNHTAAMSFVSTTGFLRTAPAGLDWTFGEVPHGPRSDKSYTKGGANVVAVSSQTKHPEEAWMLLKFLLSEENQRREVFELGVGTALLRSIAFAPQFVKRDGPPYDLTPILLQATKPVPQVAGWNEAKTMIDKALVPVWEGKTAARTALDEVAPQVNALLNAKSSG